MAGVDGAPATRELDAVVCIISDGAMLCRLVFSQFIANEFAAGN